MQWLNKLPGYQRTAYSFEWRLLKRLPLLVLAATFLSVLASVLAHLLYTEGSIWEIERVIGVFDFFLIGIVISIWIAGFIVACGCVIVWLMKGPAYVADGYDVPHSDQPKP